MEIKKIHALNQLENFMCLCRKAQELIFEALTSDKAFHLLYVAGIGDEVCRMSPIEQMFYIGNYINEVSGRNFLIELVEQKEITIPRTNKTYRVDFYVSDYIVSSKGGVGCYKEYVLKKPIVIELDGFDYHKNKKQVNYDYERETVLKLAGYDVIRFTGSQVYNDVFGCLDKVCELIKMADKEEVK